MQLEALLKFFLILVVLASALLLFPWQGPERLHAAFFRGVGNAAFSRFWLWDEAYVRFIDLHAVDLYDQIKLATYDHFRVVNPETGEVIRDPETGNPQRHEFPPAFPRLKRSRVLDTLMLCMHRDAGRRLMQARSGSLFGPIRISSRITGWWPLAFLFALIVAKPNPWGRKLWALFWGLLLTEMFVLFRLTLHMLDACYAVPGKNYAIFTWSETTLGILSKLKSVMVDNPTMSFAMPVVIWLMVGLTRKDWSSFFELLGSMREEAEDEEEQDEESGKGPGERRSSRGSKKPSAQQ